jgi:hypothetical protein
MPTQTAEQYFQDTDNLGNYQWFSFNEVIDEHEIIASDNDNYLNNTRRSQFIRVAKQGVKYLQREIRKDIKAIQFNVPENLLFPYPQDYVNWISLNIIHLDTLFPIFINEGMNTSLSALQDENGDLQFDDNTGNLILTPGTQTGNSKCVKLNNNNTHNPFQTQGTAVFNDNQARISFGSDMVGKSIVLEYYSDGLFAWGLSSSELEELNLKPIRIHKDLKEVLVKFIYQEIVGGRRNVPANEKQRARNEYKTYLHQAKLDRLGLNLFTVAKLVR